MQEFVMCYECEYGEPRISDKGHTYIICKLDNKEITDLNTTCWDAEKRGSNVNRE